MKFFTAFHTHFFMPLVNVKKTSVIDFFQKKKLFKLFKPLCIVIRPKNVIKEINLLKVKLQRIKLKLGLLIDVIAPKNDT